MDAERWQQISETYHRLVSLPSDQRREALDELKERDPDLARIVTGMLESEKDAKFLEARVPANTESADRDSPESSVSSFGGSQPAPTQIEEFKILHRLGEGGMGVVYLAYDLILERDVALKVVAGHLVNSERALARFRDEARSTAALKHPAIVPIYRFGQSGSDCYLVTEFVDGPTLARVIADQRELFPADKTQDRMAWYRRAAEIAAPIADALDCAHRADIVHRDVKPSNILIHREHGPRLTDFGIAKQITDQDRTETSIVGSCHYMSPEQADIAAKRVDRRSDVFSLGIVLYEMLSLRRPFDGPTPMQVMRAIVESVPRRLRTIDKRIPVDLETICHKAIEKRPEDRYPTAAHISADLRCFLTGEPIVARPPSWGRRVARFSRRRRAFLATVASASAVALVGWQSTRAVRDAEEESLAWVRLDLGDEAYRVFLERFDNIDTTQLPVRVELGVTPVSTQKIEIGQYRLTVVRPSDGAFCEFNLVLTDRGRASQTTLVLNDGRSKYPQSASTEDARDLGTILIGVLRSPSDSTTDMTRIPSGTYAVDRETNAEPLIHGPALIKQFFIDTRKVSNREYLEYVKTTGYRRPSFWPEDWPPAAGDEKSTPFQLMDLPVYGVTLEEAEAYARWRGKRLPTLAEWQAAARGMHGYLYPGSNEPPQADEPAARLRNDATTDSAEKQVRLFAHNAKPATVEDAFQLVGQPTQMYSNLREITGTVSIPNNSVYFCGRAWFDPILGHPLARIGQAPLVFPSPHNGFRCALSVNSTHQSIPEGDQP